MFGNAGSAWAGLGNVPLKAPFPGHEGSFQPGEEELAGAWGCCRFVASSMVLPNVAFLRRKRCAQFPKMQIFQEMV